MEKHKCDVSHSCTCGVQSLEPSDDCPVHGYVDPRKCHICGRFFRGFPKQSIEEVEVIEKLNKVICGEIKDGQNVQELYGAYYKLTERGINNA